MMCVETEISSKHGGWSRGEVGHIVNEQPRRRERNNRISTDGGHAPPVLPAPVSLQYSH